MLGTKRVHRDLRERGLPSMEHWPCVQDGSEQREVPRPPGTSTRAWSAGLQPQESLPSEGGVGH